MFSFTNRKKRSEVQGFIQRLVNQTSPNLPPVRGEARAETRYNRTIAILLAPYEDGEPLVSEAVYAVSRNFSEQGMAIVLPCPFKVTDVICGFCLETPGFLLGEVLQNAPLGGGFWQVGVQLRELIPPAELPTLIPLVAKLIPDTAFQTL